MSYDLLADLILLVHVIWVLVVVLTVPLVLIGASFGWSWIRNTVFRHVHLAMIGIVVLESYVGIPCPLTVWENEARRVATGEGAEGSFMGRMLHALIYYDFPEWVFTVAYTVFLLLVIAYYVWIPPRRTIADALRGRRDARQ